MENILLEETGKNAPVIHCPYCGARYNEDVPIVDVGYEFVDDNVFHCCLPCALAAGLKVC